ncbi:MAG: hypothetical protein H7X79_10580 [Sporomusaceae bacterium]|nr:hypothetical protein [Sporomusaceae bacterium]
MVTFNAQPVITILRELASDSHLDTEHIDDAIDALERIKDSISTEDDEAIDKVDEIQDFLEYLLTVKEPSLDEAKEELSAMISDFQEWAK